MRGVTDDWAGMPRTDVLLSIQRALWEIPTPELRGVAVGPRRGAIAAVFYYDGAAVNSDQKELVALAEAYFLADMTADVEVSFTATSHPLPQPLDLRPSDSWAYLRWEPDAGRA